MHLILKRTSYVAPEQYEVMDGDKEIGYLRLRWGHFTAHAYNPSGPIVYESNTVGEGIFDPAERDPQIKRALAAIVEHINGGAITYEIIEGE